MNISSDSESKETQKAKLLMQLYEINALIFLAEKNVPFISMFFSILQLIFVFTLSVVLFYFIYIHPAEFKIALLIPFMVFLILTYFAYINLKDTYSNFQKVRKKVIKFKSIRFRIIQLLKLYENGK